MNKTKAKELIKELRIIDGLVAKIQDELDFENLLVLIYAYTGITRDQLREKCHIIEEVNKKMTCPKCGNECYIDESPDGEFPCWHCSNCLRWYEY